MKGWICEGWYYHVGKLLIQPREGQDGRLLLGGNYRVLQDWESQDKRMLALVVPNEDEGDIRSKKLLQEDFCQEESWFLTTRRLSSLVNVLQISKSLRCHY